MDEDLTSGQLTETYVHLLEGGGAAPVPVDGTFWPELTTGRRPSLLAGRLTMAFDFDDDWSSWERHPAGDELLVLLSGRVTVRWEVEDGERHAVLSEPASYVCIPAGVWHTADVSEPSRMVFITPGRGTENRPR